MDLNAENERVRLRRAAAAAPVGDGDCFPSVWFTKKELTLDRLRDRIAVMRLHQIPLPAETQAEIDQVTAELEAARVHNLKIEKKHAAHVNALKERERRKQSAS